MEDIQRRVCEGGKSLPFILSGGVKNERRLLFYGVKQPLASEHVACLPLRILEEQPPPHLHTPHYPRPPTPTLIPIPYVVHAMRAEGLHEHGFIGYKVASSHVLSSWKKMIGRLSVTALDERDSSRE